LPYTQDSGTLAYLLELSPIFASCHHRFCIEDFPSPQSKPIQTPTLPRNINQKPG